MIFKYEIGDQVVKANNPMTRYGTGYVMMLGFDGQRVYLVDFNGARTWWPEDLLERYTPPETARQGLPRD